jgi:hypothetical protein
LLLTYDINSGSLVASNAFPDNVRGHRYSCVDDATYGLLGDSTFCRLEKIDPLTGLHVTVDTLTGVSSGFVGESHSVNAAGYYTFRGFNASGNFSLFTVDLTTAAVTSSALTTDNAAGLEESGCSYTSGIPMHESGGSLHLFPVPAKDELSIRTTGRWEKLEVISSEGRRMLFDAEGLEEMKIDVSSWPAGLYLLKLDDGKTQLLRKIIVWK